MEKIYFPLEKTVFLPREKAPIGKMEHVAVRAEVDTIEPAQTGWLCYGKLMIDIEYLPMGTGKSKHAAHTEQWQQISQQLLAAGSKEKEQCCIEVEFIQELPDRDFVYGSVFSAEVEKKTWQQIASNALEIGVNIALFAKEQQKKNKNKKTREKSDKSYEDQDYFVLEQDSFSLEDKIEEGKPADPSRTKKATGKEPEELYYYADEEGCNDLFTDAGIDDQQDTIIFMPEQAEKPQGKDSICDLDFTTKGQHLCETKQDKPNPPADCDGEITLSGEIVLEEAEARECNAMEQKPITPETKPESTTILDCVCEKEPIHKPSDKENETKDEIKDMVTEITPEESTCVNQEMVLEQADQKDLSLTPSDKSDKTDKTNQSKEEDCNIVPLPLSPKEKLRFWKGKKNKQEMQEMAAMEETPANPFAGGFNASTPAPAPAEPKKGYRLKFYVVQGGEDLAAIAEKHCVSPGSILAANKNITEEDIRTGMVLSIPM